MLCPYGPEISAADVPLREPSDRPCMGVDRVGTQPGNNAVRDQLPENSGNQLQERTRPNHSTTKKMNGGLNNDTEGMRGKAA